MRAQQASEVGTKTTDGLNLGQLCSPDVPAIGFSLTRRAAELATERPPEKAALDPASPDHGNQQFLENHLAPALSAIRPN